MGRNSPRSKAYQANFAVNPDLLPAIHLYKSFTFGKTYDFIKEGRFWFTVDDIGTRIMVSRRAQTEFFSKPRYGRSDKQ